MDFAHVVDELIVGLDLSSAVVNDDGVPEHFGFDLDDPEVLFFSNRDIAAFSAGSTKGSG